MRGIDALHVRFDTTNRGLRILNVESVKRKLRPLRVCEVVGAHPLDEIDASSRLFTDDTWIGSPFKVAGDPLAAAYLSPSASNSGKSSRCAANPMRRGQRSTRSSLSERATTGIPVVGMEATGWLNAFLNSESSSKQLRPLPLLKTFHGTLRPYQSRGVSWTPARGGRCRR